MRRFFIRGLIALHFLAITGCASFTFPEKEITAIAQVPEGHVLLVGKIELNPRLRASEIKLDVPNDIFNTEAMMSNRAIIGFSAQGDTPVEKSGFLINPELGRTFFFAVPRERVYLVGGYITVAYNISATGPRSATVNHGKVLVPGGLRLDLGSPAKVLYIGTLRLERDPFNEVTGADLIDEYETAIGDFITAFGAHETLSKAIPAIRAD